MMEEREWILLNPTCIEHEALLGLLLNKEISVLL